MPERKVASTGGHVSELPLSHLGGAFQYFGIAPKYKTPQEGLKLIAIVLMFSKEKISKYFTM